MEGREESLEELIRFQKALNLGIFLGTVALVLLIAGFKFFIVDAKIRKTQVQTQVIEAKERSDIGKTNAESKKIRLGSLFTERELTILGIAWILMVIIVIFTSPESMRFPIWIFLSTATTMLSILL